MPQLAVLEELEHRRDAELQPRPIRPVVGDAGAIGERIGAEKKLRSAQPKKELARL